jgi:LETM1 and EF-hand domain-containing protein 1
MIVISSSTFSITGTRHFIRRPLLRLVPFVLVIAILEELIPLIIIFAPNALPSTCILPSQRLKIDAKKMERQKEASQTMKSVFDEMRKSGTNAGGVSAEGHRSAGIAR